jgi:gliding motility-associated-like protein
MKRVILFLVLNFAVFQVQARHIIGGVMTYTCLGGGDYEFILTLYRDCNCTNCADFDPVAAIGIYKCNGDDCSKLSQFGTFARINVPIQTVRSVGAPSYPCLIPPNVCVQEGIYRFKLSNYNIRLPESDSSYHISYQRCCRNVTINNIIRPDDVGATYTIEITPEGQKVCNNSPVFDGFPPTVICNNFPIDFAHKATDPDGDQLEYQFCSPLLGGGQLLQAGQAQTCNGAIPTPACPPPYGAVTFIAPAYNPLQPMGGNPVVTIDANTGIISGKPDRLGQFVVGVCVLEYRNGVLLSKVFRDFQFNVANCEPTVVADVEKDAVISERNYLINSCGNYEIEFINKSYQRNAINKFEWAFNIGGARQLFSEWSPKVKFPGVGDYTGQLILNPNTDCGDTAFINVKIFPEITADFAFQYDTCIAGPVAFKDLSTTGAQRLTNWDWSFGDGNTSILQNPSHIYRIPGNLPATLKVTDNNLCQDTKTIPVNYFPVPALIVISPSDFTGCTPAEIFFDNLSFPIDNTYDIAWKFGDGGISDLISPTHTYQKSGIYTVSVEITSPIGCKTDTIFSRLIEILDAPEADFSYTPDKPTSLAPTVSFFDKSSGLVAGWEWFFGDNRKAYVKNPIHAYRDSGMYEVMQIVIHPNGCTDTAFAIIDVIPEVRYFLPNAFTPNQDGTNEIYKGVGVMDGVREFNMSIWNRWGEMVFQTDDANKGWNGNFLQNGQPAPQGVYVVYVTFTTPRGEIIKQQTFATLIR